MSGSLNKAMLIGNIGKDPEVIHFENGGKLVKFPIATGESYTKRDRGEKVEITDWHNIVMRRGLADIAEKYLRKGSKVFIEGKIRTRTYEDNGVTKYVTEIIADQMTMLGGNPNQGQSGSSSQPSAQANTSQSPKVSEPETGNSPAEDDLPF